jgi:mono/diheme cytochrome c family protein
MNAKFLAAVLAGLVGSACAQTPPANPSATRPGVAVPPPGNRTGQQVYDAECAQCHGAKGQGDGLGLSFLPVRPRNFTLKKFKLRSTASGELPTRQDLFDTITRGIRKSGMPAFDFLPENERKAVVEQILAFAGAGAKPDPAVVAVAETPATSPDRIALGQQVFEKVQCAKCHVSDPETPPRTDLKDELGQPTRAPNLLEDEFIGGDGSKDVELRLKTGMDGAPMPSFGGMIPDDEMLALAQWLASVRKPRDPLAELAYRDDRLARGRALVERFRCQACHEVGGYGGKVGPSLDTSGAKLRIEWIRAWLTDPRAHGKVFVDRYYRMPNLHLTRKNVEDLTWLILSLGQRSPRDSAPYVLPFKEADLKSGEFYYRNMCTRCHALGNVVPASVPLPVGPDLIRMAERLHYPWLQLAIVSEGTTPDQAGQIRDWLWKVCTDQGPKPPAPLPPPR